MNIIYSPSGIVDFKHPMQGLTDMRNAGFQYISLDISLCCSGYDLENYINLARKTKHYDKNDCTGNDCSKEAYEKKDLGTKYKSIEKVDRIRTPESLLQLFEPFLAQCGSHSLSIGLVRLPRLPWDTKRTDLNPLLEEIAESAIHFCGKTGCKQLVVPPLFSGIKKGTEWTVNRSYYLRLAETARKYGVTILLENQCRSYNGHLIRGICSGSADAARWIDWLNTEAGEFIDRLNTETGECTDRLNADAGEWIDRLNTEASQCIDRLNTEASQCIDWTDMDAAGSSPAFAFCLDTGICTLCGQDMQEFASALGDRLHAVLLRDCGRQQESSLLPFTAAYCGQPQSDWLSLIRGLRAIGFDGSLILDFADTASAFSPLLRPQLLPLARATAEYFKWQIEIENLLKKYDSIVLFGAGNMCRNYMKCYGRKYPPLFTCDNNQSLWGTEFCGLEIKSPEALRELSDNCGIFICNIYYREIEKQLRQMGIENIEFFNDEYMPSFHFDRLETS